MLAIRGRAQGIGKSRTSRKIHNFFVLLAFSMTRGMNCGICKKSCLILYHVNYGFNTQPFSASADYTCTSSSWGEDLLVSTRECQRTSLCSLTFPLGFLCLLSIWCLCIRLLYISTSSPSTASGLFHEDKTIIWRLIRVKLPLIVIACNYRRRPLRKAVRSQD